MTATCCFWFPADQDCDPALLRRFDRRILVPLPDVSSRRQFFENMLACPEVNSALTADDIEKLSVSTEGYSGSDLAAVCKQAAMAPVRELFHKSKGLKRRRLGRMQQQPGCFPCEAVASLGAAEQGAAEALSLRKLHMSDFEAALAKIKPAAFDAARGTAA